MRSIFVLVSALLWGGIWSNVHAQTVMQTPLYPGIGPETSMIETGPAGSSYVPLDSWLYPALDRLHALGYVDSAYLGMLPWTRLGIAHMLERIADRIQTGTENEEAKSIYFAVLREVRPDLERTTRPNHPHIESDSVFTELRGVGGTPLRDSFHRGQSTVNDNGRP